MGRRVLFGVTLLVGAGCAGLGAWQLDRLRERRAANLGARELRALPPLPDGTPLAPNRRVTLSGEYDEAREFLLRGRLVQGVPAVQVVTPFRLAGRDTAILVNRGYVPAADAVDPGAATWGEPGPRTVTGLLLPAPSRGDGAPLRRGARESWHAIDLAAMRARLPYPVAPLYLIAEADRAAGDAHTVRGTTYPFRAEVPPLGDGPHLMYAVQWFGIAGAVVAFGWFFVWRGMPRRREDRV